MENARSSIIVMRRRKAFADEEVEFNMKGLFLKAKDEDSLFNLYGMVIGPEDTPYHHGFFMFDINCTDDYPFKPPAVKFLTTNGKIRMTPNYYQNGKVCLSIINTWDKNDWQPSYKFDSLLIQFQSQLQKNSLRCEPGYTITSETAPKMIEYENYVTYNSINYAFCEMVELCLRKDTYNPISTHFRNIVLDYASKNIDGVLSNFYKWVESQQHIIRDNKMTVKCIYSTGCGTYDLHKLEERLLNIQNKLQNYKGEDVDEHEEKDEEEEI